MIFRLSIVLDKKTGWKGMKESLLTSQRQTPDSNISIAASNNSDAQRIQLRIHGLPSISCPETGQLFVNRDINSVQT